MNDIPGLKEVGKNVFNNSEFGMYAEFCKFITKENIMTNVGTGIYSVNAQGDQTISENEIENCDFGIDVRTSNGFEFQILDNIITTNEVNTVDPIGIYVNDFEATTGGSGVFIIGGYDEEFLVDYGNVINSNGQTGISLNGAQNSFINHNRVLMDEADANSIERWGILVNGGTMNEIKNNLINDWYYDDYNMHDQEEGQPCSVTYPCEIDDKTAITILDATYCRISCNRTNATHTGLQFVATTSNKSLHLDIRGNSMHWHNDGLAVGGSGYASGTKIGLQPPTSESVTPGNYWKGDESGGFGIASTHLFNTTNAFDQFIVNEEDYDDTYFFPYVNLPILDPLNIFPQNAAADDCDIEPQSKIIESYQKAIYSTCCYIHPNPTSDKLILNYSFKEGKSHLLKISDLFGKTLTLKTIDEDFTITEIDISSHSTGLYLLTIFENEMPLYKTKIIIVR